MTGTRETRKCKYVYRLLQSKKSKLLTGNFCVVVDILNTWYASAKITVLPWSAIICTHAHVPCILAVASIRGWRLFHSELRIVWLLFKGGNYSWVASIQGWCLFEGKVYLRVVSIWGWCLFEGGVYSRVVSHWFEEIQHHMQDVGLLLAMGWGIVTDL